MISRLFIASRRTIVRILKYHFRFLKFLITTDPGARDARATSCAHPGGLRRTLIPLVFWAAGGVDPEPAGVL